VDALEDALVDACVVGFGAGFGADLVALSATEGPKGSKDCAISSSKCTIGFLDLLDRRSAGSAITSKLHSFNLMNSLSLCGRQECQGAKMKHRSERRDTRLILGIH
jgi:hypothetical protein